MKAKTTESSTNNANIPHASTSVLILPLSSFHSSSRTVTVTSSTLPSLNLKEPFERDKSRPSREDKEFLCNTHQVNGNETTRNYESDDVHWNNLQFNTEIEI